MKNQVGWILDRNQKNDVHFKIETKEASGHSSHAICNIMYIFSRIRLDGCADSRLNYLILLTGPMKLKRIILQIVTFRLHATVFLFCA